MNVFSISKRRVFRSIKHRTRRIAPRPVDWIQQFVPFSLERTSTDSCVIGNGVPKAGMHLLYSIVNYLNKWQDIGVYLKRNLWETELSREDFEQHACAAEVSVKKLRNGQMVLAQLGWSQQLENVIGRKTHASRVKHLMIFRDPRDLVVSWLNWATHSEKYPRSPSTKANRRFMLENFSNDDERLTYVIEQTKGDYFGLLEYAPWLSSPNCVAVKFEDLYPDIVSLRDNTLGQVLREILGYLEIDANTIDPLDFYDKVHGKSLTASSEEHKVGQYKRVFNDHHHALFDNPDFRSTLEVFGYEW